MTDIGGVRLTASLPTSTSRTGVLLEQTVRLAAGQNSPLAAGETAKAEVLAIKQALQNFQVIFQLTLNNGQQVRLSAESPVALPLGALFGVSALSPSRLAIRPDLAAEPPLDTLDTDQLPVGTLLQGRVVSNLPSQEGGPTTFKTVINLLNTTLSGKQLLIESPHLLKPGSLLTAEVRGAQQLAIVSSPGRLDQLELGQQLASQYQRQGSLTGLLQALNTLPGPSQHTNGLQNLATQLLATLPDIESLSDAETLKTALAHSGLWLERHLIAGHPSTANQDQKALLLRLIGQLTTALSLSPAGSASVLTPIMPAALRNALSAFGQTSPRQAALSFPLPPRIMNALAEEGVDLKELLKLASAALARLQTHQLSSLEQTRLMPDGSVVLTWQGELPMRNGEHIIALQYKLQEERKSAVRESGQSLWRLELAFDLAPLGQMQVQAQLSQGSVSSRLWAERPETVRLITHELDHLRERLDKLGLIVGELNCQQGRPPSGPRTHLEEQWIDESA
ncbi:flagellar hook-length control protein FliK [Pseudomonas duriflava]|uniref:Flagellar hook-length control protein FliK n=1 Tax=Pseudomonas duriflava TaxID=459528 RepID=A0A562QAX8_9PSED|nr:flagellar hook-length control protein FliK [Pseudomonas duriflava]TWI53892.1 flagellar hook-length control protein FliK [Pseudomonas duriflava]